MTMTTTQAATEEHKTQIPSAGPERIPMAPTAVKDAKVTREQMFTLRHFHLGDPTAKSQLDAPGNDLLPALLDPFRETERLRYAYPLFLFPPDAGNGAQPADDLACPISQCLQRTVATFAADDQAARILKDHLPWLEDFLRKTLAATEGPVAAALSLVEAGKALQAHLGQLDGASEKQLAEDLQRLHTTLPDGGMLLGYGRYAALHLLVHAIRSRAIPRRVRFAAEVADCIRGLEELFEVEWGKSDESIEPRMARDSVGPEGQRFDPLALSTIIDHSRGTRQMSPDRRARIQQTLDVLKHWRTDPVLVWFVHNASLVTDWLHDDPTLAEINDVAPCSRATELFDSQAAALARVLAAVRIARLEIDNKYDPVIHDPWFGNFDWEAFSQEELLLVPTVIAVESANHVAGDGLHSFSRLLNSGRPVQILIRDRPSENPGAERDEGATGNTASADGGYGGGQAGSYGGGQGATGNAATGGSGYSGQTGGGSGATGNTASADGGYGGGQAGSHGGGKGAAGNVGGTNIGGFAMTAAPGGGYRHSSEGQTGSAQGGQPGGGASGAQGNPQSYSQHSLNNNQNNGEGQAEYQHYTAGMPASQVGRVLGNYLGGAPITPSTADPSSKSHGEFFPESTPQHFGHQEIIQALSNLQSMPQFVQPDYTHFDGEAIKQAVLAEIAKKSGGAVTKRINTIAEKTIDFIELIFDAIIDDEDISDTIKALLLRLQIPIIKASMSDQEFFIYDDHPARLFLDSVADVGIGITDHADEMYQHLDKIVNNILGEYDLTTATFQTALDALNAVIEEQEKISRAKEEEEQNQLLRKHARATVLKALRAATSGRNLPEAVHPLILKRWPTLMFNHYVKKGKENNEWVNLVLTLRHIVESVQPVRSAEHLAKLIAEKDPLFEVTEQYLNASSNSKKDVQNIMASYKETVQMLIDDANFTEQEVIVAEEALSHAEPVEEAPIEEPSTREKTKLPSNVMPGMWFQIYMGEDKTDRRCKLSVIIIEDENLMFVDHKGALVAEKSFDEFNDEVAHDKTKMIMGHSAFDHAFKAVIDRIQ